MKSSVAIMTKAKRVPIRSCVVCRETDAKLKLIRIVRQKAADGTVSVQVDPTGKANGRGAYVCSRQECVETALRQHKIERSLRASVLPDGFAEQLRSVLKALTASEN